MIREYGSGADFLAENRELLERNRYMSVFFFIDGKVLDSATDENYALRAEAEGGVLLAMRVRPYNLLLYGDAAPLGELLGRLSEGGYRFDGILCPMELGELLPDSGPESYRLSMGMDFMEALEVTEPSYPGIETPTGADTEELLECFTRFFADCGLPDVPTVESVRARLPGIRLIRADGKIVSCASMNPDTVTSRRLSHVYTRPEYRGKGYARKVVNSIKNEILASGYAATLNVDRKNPVSNHLYSSLGFRKVFSQGVYEKVR